MLDNPTPSVSCTGLKGNGSTWEVGFSVASTEKLAAARTELLNPIHKQLRHAGIALAMEGNAVPEPAEVPTLVQVLGESDLFGVMAEAHRIALTSHF